MTTDRANPIDVAIEVGHSRMFATALDWPGWCRSGRDEAAALHALYDYGPRYAAALKTRQLPFHAPADLSAFVVVERQAGNTTTDFGAPNLALPRDVQPVGPDELERWQDVLQACWQTFDAAAQAANDSGHPLRTGPRGGGRDVSKIVEHVHTVDAAYLVRLGRPMTPSDENTPSDSQSEHQALPPVRQAILTTLAAAVRGEVLERGPRGGVRWTPRYFVRRLAWHELDHAWEIEDRASQPANQLAEH